MIKRFEYKEIELCVKTNFLKDGKAYFSKDIQERLEQNYREKFFEKHMTDEQKLISLFRALQFEGIKVDYLKIRDLTYDGTTMTEMTRREQK